MNALGLFLLATGLFQAPEGSSARHDAARALERVAVQRSVGVDGSSLAGALAECRRLLGQDSELVDELEQKLGNQRAWELDPQLRRAQLAEFIDDLQFTPTPAHEIPEGFPAPTPVREIEVKTRPATKIARVDLTAHSLPDALELLNDHAKSRELTVCSPVELAFRTRGTGLQESTLGIYLPAEDAVGGSEAVSIDDEAEHEFLSIGVRGVADSASVSGARYRLAMWLRDHPSWVPTGDPRLLSYSAPDVRGRDRFFELEIPVRTAERIVIDFSDPEEAARWRAVDDVVMGGVSSSRVESTTEGTCVFTGEVSLENNGGFASVRTEGDRCTLIGAEAIVLRVRGDGQYYRLRCRTGIEYDMPSYQATFATMDGRWTEVTIPLRRFQLGWRGRSVVGPPLDPALVRSIGLVIADKQEGPFRLELQSIGTR